MSGSPLPNNAIIANRVPGPLQGIMLLLPITMSVAGITVFVATAALMVEHFKDLPNGEYLVQLLITMPAIWIVLFSPIAGWLADRYGRRRILLISMITYNFVGVAPFFLENIYVILLTRCGVGICESVVVTVTTTMICDYFRGPARERWLGAQTAVASLAALLIIFAGGQLGARFGWHGPFLIYLYSIALVVGVLLFTWEPSRDEVPATSASGSDAEYRQFPVARMIGICAITVLASIMFYATLTQNANALVALGVHDPATIGGLSALASLGVPLGTVLFWWLGRLRIGSLLAIDFALIGVGFALMAASTSPTAYAWAAGIQQIGCGLILPTLLVWATRGLAFDVRGRGTGVWQAAFAIGQFLSGVTLVFLGHQLGGLLAAFSTLALVSLAAACVALSSRLYARFRNS